MIDDGDLVVGIVAIIRVPIRVRKVRHPAIRIVHPAVIRKVPARAGLVIHSGQPGQQVIRIGRVGHGLRPRQIVVPVDPRRHPAGIVREVYPLGGHGIPAGLAFLLHLSQAIRVVIGVAGLVVGRAADRGGLLGPAAVRVVDIGQDGRRHIGVRSRSDSRLSPTLETHTRHAKTHRVSTRRADL